MFVGTCFMPNAENELRLFALELALELFRTRLLLFVEFFRVTFHILLVLLITYKLNVLYI